jgi:hypothetical protein
MNDDLGRALLLRRLTGSILASSLTHEQIVSLAQHLASDRDFSSDLANAILTSSKAFSPRVAGQGRLELSERRDGTDSLSIDQAVKWINDHNIPKRQLISTLLERRILHASPATLQSQSIRDIVTRVYASSSPKAVSKFFSLLGVSAEPDAYLAGIEGRQTK